MLTSNQIKSNVALMNNCQNAIVNVCIDGVSLCERSGTGAERAEKSHERRGAVRGSRKTSGAGGRGAGAER